MKNIYRIFSIFVVVYAVTIFANAQETSKAVLKASGVNGVIEISLADKDLPLSLPTAILIATDADGVDSETAVTLQNFTPPYKKFSLKFPGYNPNAKLLYEVDLKFDAKNKEGIIFRRRLKLPVEPTLSLLLERNSAACTTGNNLQLIISTPNISGFDWRNIEGWLKNYQSTQNIIAKLTVKQKGEADDEFKVRISNSAVISAVGKDLGVCLNLDKTLPPGSFDALLDFPPNVSLPPDITVSVSAKKLDGTTATTFPEDKEAENPDTRKLERTLDIGGAFTSSVIDKEVPATATTGATTVRTRQNRGVLDVGFQLPQILKTEYVANKWMHFFTPLFVKASISTDKIDKDTLSQNRVLFGFQGEARYRKRRTEPTDKSFVAIHRIEWGVTHASDRDFKQKEIYASVSYKPILDSLYKPLRINAGKTIGFRVEPSVGFDFGKTYSRKDPAEEVLETPLIKRGNVGLKLGLDITSYLTFTAEDTFYIRWEDPEHRSRNLFKAQGEFKLFRSNRNRLAHSLFITYEKGQGPPFATPQVNSVRVGYRVFGDFCNVYCR